MERQPHSSIPAPQAAPAKPEARAAVWPSVTAYWSRAARQITAEKANADTKLTEAKQNNADADVALSPEKQA